VCKKRKKRRVLVQAGGRSRKNRDGIRQNSKRGRGVVLGHHAIRRSPRGLTEAKRPGRQAIGAAGTPGKPPKGIKTTG